MLTIITFVYQFIKINLNKETEIIKTTLCNFAKARTGEEFHCSSCIHNHPVISFCRDCNSFLGPKCVSYHKEIRLLILHTVIDFKRIPIENLHVLDFAPKSFCRNPEHIPTEQWQNRYELLFYCTTCKVLLCKKGRRQHARHFVIILDSKFSIKIMIKDLIDFLEANPQTELKQMKDVLTSILSNHCRQNLMLNIKILASIESSDPAKDMSPDTVAYIDRPNNDTVTQYTHTVQPPRQQVEEEIIYERDIHLTRNGSEVHVCKLEYFL